MAKNSAIEWTDHTLNFWIGCQEVSPACDHCYAKTENARRKWVNGWGPDGERRRTGASNWHQLRKWNRHAGNNGIRHRVFSNSLSDFFDNRARPEWRREAWHFIEQSPHLDFLILTKRPQNIAGMLPDPETGVKPWGDGWPNVWLGVTAENQAEADRRIPLLLRIPATVHFISCEPLLGPVDLTAVRLSADASATVDVLTGRYGGPNKGRRTHVGWVIVGGESGPHRRPMDLAWARGIKDQCTAAGVPFFGKQLDKRQPLPEDLMLREFPAT